MDAFASPSIRSAPSSEGWSRTAVSALLTLGLGLSLMSLPGAPDARLDGSWQEMLVQAHYRGLQFGRDVIFTWGPWGFLCTRYHLGALGAVPILIWQTAGQLLLAFTLVILTDRLAAWRRILFFAGLLTIQWLFQDTVYFVVMALVVIGGLMRREATLLQLVAWTLLLGFLAQLKFTYFVVSSAAVLAGAACWWCRESSRRSLAILVGYSASVALAWCAAGQSLGNLYPYVLRSLEIAGGYGDAMGIDESPAVFAWGAGTAILCFFFCWDIWRSVPDRNLGRTAAAFLAFTFFVMWKESFTRADFISLGGHIFGLFGLVLILGPVSVGLLFPGKRWHWFDASFLFCLVGVAKIDPQFYSQAPRVEWQRLYDNFLRVGRLGHQPAAWQEIYATACEINALPSVRDAVGKGTIDVTNYSEGAALLNGLTLSARPIFQSYSAYTPSLEGWNLRYYQSDKAPDFLLWDSGRIDNRYPGQDDAMLLAALPGHYEPALQEAGYWLFRKITPASKVPALHRLLFKRTVHLGEPIEIPLDTPSALWLEADAKPNALGRARALLYKPAQINLVTTDQLGNERTWRLLPRVAKAGFLLVPTLERGEDLVGLMNGETRTRLSHIRFEAPGDQDEFWSHIDVNVLAIPSLPLSAIPGSLLVELAIADRRPTSVESAEKQEVIAVPEGKALLLHAPGRIAFDVPKGAPGFSGSFGMRAGSYSDGGHTAGVEFGAYAVWPGGRVEKLWSRYLDPVAREADRGTQHFDVDLPVDTPATLVLRTGTGPDNDNRWGWSYVTGLQFTPSTGK
jgi:hypothetical protein